MKKLKYLFLLLLITVLALSGCGNDKHGLNKDNPQSITVWNYYNGALAIEFDQLVTEFNNTVGRENGIVVYAESMSTVPDLENALRDSANEKVGSAKMPNIFQCYPDMAVELNEIMPLVNLDDYVSENDKKKYLSSYITTGCIGENNEWKIFPIAQSTEVLMLNKTDWDKFAAATGATTDDLSTWERIADTAKKYYEWTGGKAFFGRDAFANYPIVGSAQLGHEIFNVKNGKVTLDFDKDVMRRLWDNFYVPYINGYYTQVGTYRSDDVKIGEIISFVCSTSSSIYFPTEVSVSDDVTYPIDYMILPLPNFEGAPPYEVQQGAGMAVSKSTEAEEYASILFLEWFTSKEQNLKFSLNSGYLPVTNEALEIKTYTEYFENNSAKPLTVDTLKVALEQTRTYTPYATQGFINGSEARNILNTSMIDKAIEDRDSLNNRISQGEDRDMLISEYTSDMNFDSWYNDTLNKLEQVCKDGK